MLFWSKSRTAPSVDSRRDDCARRRRSVRSFAKSIRCSQSTAIVAPREAMFIRPLSLVCSVLSTRLFIGSQHRSFDSPYHEMPQGHKDFALFQSRAGKKGHSESDSMAEFLIGA